MAKLVAKKHDSNEDVLWIDRDRLDEHWIEQPQLVYRYMKQAADLRQEMEAAKTACDLRAVEVGARVRERPAKYGLEKITEGGVKEVVAADKEYQLKCSEMAEVRHTLDLCQAVVAALDHKKRALENLVDLHAQGYFASPRASEATRDDMQELEKRFSRTRGKKKE